MWTDDRNKGTGNRHKGTDNRDKGTESSNKDTDNRNKGTGNRNKGTDNRGRRVRRIAIRVRTFTLGVERTGVEAEGPDVDLTPELVPPPRRYHVSWDTEYTRGHMRYSASMAHFEVPGILCTVEHMEYSGVSLATWRSASGASARSFRNSDPAPAYVWVGGCV